MKQKKLTFQNIFGLVVLLLLPVIIGVLGEHLWGISQFLISAIVYFVILFFLIPSGNFLGANSDLQSKKINPHFKTENRSSSKITIKRIILIVIMLVSMLLSMLLYLNDLGYKIL